MDDDHHHSCRPLPLGFALRLAALIFRAYGEMATIYIHACLSVCPPSTCIVFLLLQSAAFPEPAMSPSAKGSDIAGVRCCTSISPRRAGFMPRVVTVCTTNDGHLCGCPSNHNATIGLCLLPSSLLLCADITSGNESNRRRRTVAATTADVGELLNDQRGPSLSISWFAFCATYTYSCTPYRVGDHVIDIPHPSVA